MRFFKKLVDNLTKKDKASTNLFDKFKSFKGLFSNNKNNEEAYVSPEAPEDYRFNPLVKDPAPGTTYSIIAKLESKNNGLEDKNYRNFSSPDDFEYTNTPVCILDKLKKLDDKQQTWVEKTGGDKKSHKQKYTDETLKTMASVL